MKLLVESLFSQMNCYIIDVGFIDLVHYFFPSDTEGFIWHTAHWSVVAMFYFPFQ